MADIGIDVAALRRTSAPALICARARTEATMVAFRAKKLGLYRERTWADYARLVAQAAKGLKALGVGKGDRVGIFAHNGLDYLMAMFASWRDRPRPIGSISRTSTSFVAAASHGRPEWRDGIELEEVEKARR